MNAHMIQLPLIPSRRITSVKKFALSVAVVAATIEKPMSHHGIERPDVKKSLAVFLDLSDANAGMSAKRAKNAPMTIQSSPFNNTLHRLSDETLHDELAGRVISPVPPS